MIRIHAFYLTYRDTPCDHADIVSYVFLDTKADMQKQPSVGVLIKRCSKNMQQIYRRTPMPKWSNTLKQFVGKNILGHDIYVILDHIHFCDSLFKKTIF